MKKFITLGLISITMFGLSNTTKAQGKIGYISADEIMVLMPESAKADTQLNSYQQALYQSLQDRQNTFNDAVAKFIKDSATMNASVKEVKRGELQKESAALSGGEQTIQQQMQQKQQELVAPIQKRLLTAIQEVAKENGYTYVFPKEALLVAPPGDDIANLVKRKLGLKVSTGTTTTAPSTTTPEKVKIKSK
jgi:outer membrane protein